MKPSHAPVHICYNALFLQGHLGGIGNYAWHLLRHVRQQRPDWKISLLVPKVAAGNFRDLPGIALIEKDIRSRWARLLYFHFVLPFRMRGIDLLHSVGNMGLLFSPVRQVITIHDLYEQVSPERFSWLKRTLMKRVISRSGASARAICADSFSTRNDIARFYPHIAGKAKVIHLGNKYPVVAAPREQVNRDFVFVGTLEPGKNLAHILQAFALYRRTQPGKLLVVGAEGWGQSHLPALLDGLGIRADVGFLGYVGEDALRGIYASSLALVLASSYEGFGLPVVEAMACGCQVICARNSSLPESGGDSAMYFETGDIEGLARRMADAGADPQARLARIRSGLLHARGFTWERTASETLSVYAKVLADEPIA